MAIRSLDAQPETSAAPLADSARRRERTDIGGVNPSIFPRLGDFGSATDAIAPLQRSIA